MNIENDITTMLNIFVEFYRFVFHLQLVNRWLQIMLPYLQTCFLHVHTLWTSLIEACSWPQKCPNKVMWKNDWNQSNMSWRSSSHGYDVFMSQLTYKSWIMYSGSFTFSSFCRINYEMHYIFSDLHTIDDPCAHDIDKKIGIKLKILFSSNIVVIHSRFCIHNGMHFFRNLFRHDALNQLAEKKTKPSTYTYGYVPSWHFPFSSECSHPTKCKPRNIHQTQWNRLCRFDSKTLYVNHFLVLSWDMYTIGWNP